MLGIDKLTGQNVIGQSGNVYSLIDIAGSGSQGVVYKEKTGKYMVKFYYKNKNSQIDNEILEKLYFIKNIKMPRNFVKIVDTFKEPFIGYVMERVEGYKPLNSLLIPPNNQNFAEWYNADMGLRGRYFLGYIIAKAFGELSKENLAYCDISGNNILVRITENGASVKMIDIDNIYIPGNGSASIIGTPRYIAPEIIKKEKTPDIFSDNYSLAVILFELLRIGHPYISDEIADGAPEDENKALEGYAEYVTADNSQYMLPGEYVFTQRLEELFRRCFVDGKGNRLSRPSAREFEYAFLEASNTVIKCPICGCWHLPKMIGKKYEPCPWGDENEAPHISKPKAWLNFYDYLYADGLFSTKDPIEKKPINSFMLREGKNQIKSYYVMRTESLCMDGQGEDNFFIIAKDVKGYHAYNQFSKDGISIREFLSGKISKLEVQTEKLLHSGDEIIFTFPKGSATEIECGGKRYSFARVARFSEDKK